MNIIYRRSVSIKCNYAEYSMEEGNFQRGNRVTYIRLTKENREIIDRGFSSGKRKAQHLQCGKLKLR